MKTMLLREVLLVAAAVSVTVEGRGYVQPGPAEVREPNPDQFLNEELSEVFEFNETSRRISDDLKHVDLDNILWTDEHSADLRMGLDGVVIDGQYLTFSTEEVSWFLANDRCTLQNGRLAVLNNPQAVHTHIVSNYGGQRFWLGGSDRDNEGAWIWNNGQSFTGFPWGPGQPDNAGNNEHCLEWGFGNNYNDEPCPKAQRYVCEYDGVVIDGQFLKFSTEKVTWLLANDRCESQNGRLAVLKNPQAVHDYISSNYGGERFWLGGSDRDNEGAWIWNNGQSFAGFPWGPGQPDNAGNNEHCLEWGFGNNYNDEPCYKTQRYVCEYGAMN